VYNDSFLTGFNGPFPTVSGYAGTEISSTVSLLYQNDWDVDYVGRAAEDWSSKCIDMLHRANENKAQVVNFMVTHYWVDDNFDGKVSQMQGGVWMCAGLQRCPQVCANQAQHGQC
jgi:hypothetical protein